MHETRSTNDGCKKFWQAAANRAMRTFAQTALAVMGTTVVRFDSVDWVGVLSISLTAAIGSFLLSMATGLPEAEDEDPF